METEPKKLEFMTEEELSCVMDTLGKVVVLSAERLGLEMPAFCLILFNDHACRYVANCERGDVVEAMRKTVTEELRQQEDVPR